MSTALDSLDGGRHIGGSKRTFKRSSVTEIDVLPVEIDNRVSGVASKVRRSAVQLDKISAVEIVISKILRHWRARDEYVTG